MELTEDQLVVAADAWAAARRGGGIVIKGDFYPAAHWLAEQGWLRRRFEPDGEMSWWWTSEAESALDINRLVASVEGRDN